MSSTDDILEALHRIESLLRINARPRILLTRRDAAESLGISLSSFDRYVRDDIRKVMVGTTRMYHLPDLEAWAAERGDHVDDYRKT